MTMACLNGMGSALNTYLEERKTNAYCLTTVITVIDGWPCNESNRNGANTYSG